MKKEKNIRMRPQTNRNYKKKFPTLKANRNLIWPSTSGKIWIGLPRYDGGRNKEILRNLPPNGNRQTTTSA
ncbi:hypothetical protein V3C99_003795 [Haemonchus contortus]